MSFASEVDTFISKTAFKLDEEYAASAFQLWTDIVDGTPRITGTLRANWQFGTKQNASKYGPQAAQGAKARATKAKMQVTLEDAVIIFNNMEYAEVVENGLAGTARVPRRMVAKAIALAQAKGSIP